MSIRNAGRAILLPHPHPISSPYATQPSLRRGNLVRCLLLRRGRRAFPPGWLPRRKASSLERGTIPEKERPLLWDGYRFLIRNGHRPHVSMRCIDHGDQHRIRPATCPTHSPHTPPPPEVSLFKPLRTACTVALTDVMKDGQGLRRITQRDLHRRFRRPWDVAWWEKTIRKALGATGISPRNPATTLDGLESHKENRPSSRGSGHSVLGMSSQRES